jgi:hypothetical protein
MTSVASPALASALRDLRVAVAADSLSDLALKLTLVLVLLHGATNGAAQVPVRVLCGIMLIFPQLLRQRFFWWPLFAGLFAANAQAWFTIDNHKYLILYWTLACIVSLSIDNPRRYLLATARVLTAMVFGFATAWKLLGREYFDGSFMYWTFLNDPRVFRVASLVSGYSPEEIRLGSEAISTAGALGLRAAAIPLLDSPGLWLLAYFLSWLGLLVEGTVAIMHAIPSQKLYRLRHYSLMVFIALTYFLLPVSGFAFVLTVLGFAQCEEADEAMRWRYLILLGIVQLIVLDWQSLLPVG